MASADRNDETYRIEDYGGLLEDENLSGLETLSHLYGLSRREKQFQELYEDFSRYSRVRDFRDGHSRKEEAYDNFMESFETYFGPISESDSSQAHADAAFVSANIEVLSGLSNMHGNVTEGDFRELISDIRENKREL